MNKKPRAGSTARLEVKKLAGIGLFTAIVVVLQLIGSVIKIGQFSPSLVLVPIVIGAAVYGVEAGAFLGFVFSFVVLIACITGADMGGSILWNTNPFFCALICLVKGTAAGWAAGVVYKAFSKKHLVLAVVLAAIICPVVNTGLFCILLALFFKSTLIAWAGGSGAVYYVFVTLIGINFLIEVLINVVLSPTIVKLINIRKKISD